MKARVKANECSNHIYPGDGMRRKMPLQKGRGIIGPARVRVCCLCMSEHATTMEMQGKVTGNSWVVQLGLVHHSATILAVHDFYRSLDDNFDSPWFFPLSERSIIRLNSPA